MVVSVATTRAIKKRFGLVDDQAHWVGPRATGVYCLPQQQSIGVPDLEFMVLLFLLLAVLLHGKSRE